MKNLFSFSTFTRNTSFLWREVALDKSVLGGKAEWAKEQLKNETVDELGNLLEKDILTKDAIIQLLNTDDAKENWNKNTDKPKNSARYTLALQAGLKMLKYNTGTIDALFGNQTKSAVVAFQKAEGLKVDGAPGPQTIGKILEILAGLLGEKENEKVRKGRVIEEKKGQEIGKLNQVKGGDLKSNTNSPDKDLSLSDSAVITSESSISGKQNIKGEVKESDYPIDVSNVIVQDNTNIQRDETPKVKAVDLPKVASIGNIMTSKEEKKEVYGDEDGNRIEKTEIKGEKKKELVSTEISTEEKILNNKKETINKTYKTKYLANKEGKNLSVTISPVKALSQQEAKEKGLELMSGGFELNKNGFISVLFLGKDASGIRPDSIMQFLIDPYSGDMSQVSISRDVCVKNAKGKLVKLNSLKKKELLGAIEDITGQDTKYETSVDINNFESVIQPLLDKNFPEGRITVDFGNTKYEIAGKKYTGELKLNAKELLTVSRARRGVLKNGRSTGGSDTARRSRQMEIISSALNPLNNNPISFIGMVSEASNLISNIEGGRNINVRKFATDLFINRKNRTTKSFTTKITNGNVRIPYSATKTHAAAYVDLNKTRADLQGFFGKDALAIVANSNEGSREEFSMAEKTLLKQGMTPDILKFIKGQESEDRTVDGLLKERGYSMELISTAEQVPLNNKYSDALQKIESLSDLPIGTYSLVLDAGKDFQKGYLIQKQERNWLFKKTFPISTGKKGISNIVGSQGTPDGLVFVKNIINGHLDEIIKHKTPQGKNSVLNGPATVNTTALVLTSGELKNSSIEQRCIYLHETEKISKLGTRDSGACIRSGTFVATEIGEYIKKNNLDKTPVYIANTEISESLANNEVTELAEKLINSAKEFEGHPYDTSWDDRDGFASVNTVNGKYRYLDNFTGEKKETDKKPLVCIDLVVQSLLKTKNIPSLREAMKKGDFYMRRTINFEKLVTENPQDFSITHPNVICEFPQKRLSKKVLIQEGDILTTTNLETGGRHIGIVTELDAQGNPLKMIHSNYKGVGETPFFNSTAVIDSNHRKTRYDGFLAKTTRIDSVIRLKK